MLRGSLSLYPTESLLWLLEPAFLFLDLFCSLASLLPFLIWWHQEGKKKKKEMAQAVSLHSSPLNVFTPTHPASDISLPTLSLQVPFYITLNMPLDLFVTYTSGPFSLWWKLRRASCLDWSHCYFCCPFSFSYVRATGAPNDKSRVEYLKFLCRLDHMQGKRWLQVKQSTAKAAFC